MTRYDNHPTWTREDSRFILEKSGVPLDVDGYKIGEPTGKIICEDCGRGAWVIDEIDHGNDCENPAAE
jgi:hypothetical protein